jgi:hypothetical protein
VFSSHAHVIPRHRLSACLIGALVTCEYALKTLMYVLETREPSYVTRAAKTFFYSCGPRPVENHGTRGDTGTLSSGRQGLKP